MTDWRAIYEAGELKRGDNLCTGCFQNFAGVRAFDLHRIGRHDYTFLEGTKMDPPRWDGRRCRDVEEMQALGWWKMTAEGRWSVSPLLGQNVQSWAAKPKQAARSRQKATLAAKGRTA